MTRMVRFHYGKCKPEWLLDAVVLPLSTTKHFFLSEKYDEEVLKLTGHCWCWYCRGVRKYERLKKEW